jgi:hypothetical protein
MHVCVYPYPCCFIINNAFNDKSLFVVVVVVVVVVDDVVVDDDDDVDDEINKKFVRGKCS